MKFIMGILSSFLGFYSLLIVIRIMLTWFSSARHSKPAMLLARVTDPYLDWWRRNFNLRAGILDLSPIAAMAALSVAQTVCSSIARQGRISLGSILAICLSALWSAAGFIVGFCIVVLVLRLIAYWFNSNMFSPFWQVVDSISRPLLYRINRIIFGKRIVSYLTGIIASIAALGVLWLLGHFAVRLLFGLLLRSPL